MHCSWAEYICQFCAGPTVEAGCGEGVASTLGSLIVHVSFRRNHDFPAKENVCTLPTCKLRPKGNGLQDEFIELPLTSISSEHLKPFLILIWGIACKGEPKSRKTSLPRHWINGGSSVKKTHLQGPHWAQLPTNGHMDLTSLLTNSLNTYSISICDSLESNAAKFCRQADFDDLFVVSKGAAVQFAGDWSRIAGCSWRMLAYVCACERLRLRRVVAMHSKNYQAEPLALVSKPNLMAICTILYCFWTVCHCVCVFSSLCKVLPKQEPLHLQPNMPLNHNNLLAGKHTMTIEIFWMYLLTWLVPAVSTTCRSSSLCCLQITVSAVCFTLDGGSDDLRVLNLRVSSAGPSKWDVAKKGRV